PGELQRHVRSKMGEDPFGKLSRFGGIVVQRRNHQVGDLKPDRRLLLQPCQRLQHRLKMRQRNFPVEIFRKRLEVHIRRIDVVVDVMEGLKAFTENFYGKITLDRKSTRLNSSHEWISYAVFCLKKKNN